MSHLLKWLNQRPLHCHQINDGDPVNAATDNAGFMSRTTDTSTVGKVDLENTDAASGTSIENSQREHNSIASFTGKSVNVAEDETPTWNSDNIGTPNQPIKNRVDSIQTVVESNQTSVTDNTDDISDLRTLSGTVNGDTDLGTFLESIISDNVDIKTALQELETALAPITDGLDFQGVWDANTNSPTLTSSTGTKGHFYIVDTSGSTTLDGISDWDVGDWAVFDGTVWRKVDNTDAVSSVNGQTGAVTLDADDIDDSTTTNKFVNNSSIDDLTDVDTTTVSPSINDTLVWDGSNWVPGAGGSGSGFGGINLFVNPNFDLNIDEVDTYDDGATATPVDCDGGSPTVISVSHETTSPLRGDGSLRISKSAADGQGEGAVIGEANITVAEADLEKTREIEFIYKPTSNYETGDLEVFFYDVTNDQFLSVTGKNSEILQGSSVRTFKGRVTLTDSTDYRLAFHITSTNALAWDVDVDQLRIGEVTTLAGSYDEYLGELTTTGSWTTNTSYNGKYWRKGEFLIGNVEIDITGAPNAIQLTLDLPSSLSLDVLGALDPRTSITTFAGMLDDADGSAIPIDVKVNDANSLFIGTLVEDNESNNLTRRASLTNTSPLTIANGDRITIWYKVPIVGWESGATLTPSEVETIQAKYSTNALQSIPNNTVTIVDFEDLVFDELNTVTTGSSWNFEAPRAGKYDVYASISWGNGTTWTAGNANELYLYVNGILRDVMERDPVQATGNYLLQITGFSTVDLDEGDTVDIRVLHNRGSSTQLHGDGNYIIIKENPRFKENSVVGQTSIAIIKDIKAQGTNSQTIPDDTWTTRDLNTLEVIGDESFISLISNQFTLQKGKYLVEWFSPQESSNIGVSRLFDVDNSSVVDYGSNTRGNSTNVAQSIGFSNLDIPVNTTYRLDHFVNIGPSTQLALNLSGVTETYTQIKITKLA